MKLGVRKKHDRTKGHPPGQGILGMLSATQHYIKDYGIIAKPLHDITKKGANGPPPWIKGTSYDLAFVRLKTLILNGKLYLHHKD